MDEREYERMRKQMVWHEEQAYLAEARIAALEQELITERDQWIARRAEARAVITQLEARVKEAWADGYNTAVSVLAQRESCSPTEHTYHRSTWQREDGSCMLCPREDVSS
jgi:hypothetical protein